MEQGLPVIAISRFTKHATWSALPDELAPSRHSALQQKIHLRSCQWNAGRHLSHCTSLGKMLEATSNQVQFSRLRCSRMKKRVSGKQWVTAGQELHFLVQPRQQERHSATYGLKIINSKEKEENLLENNSFVGNGLSDDVAIACKYSHRQKSTWKVSLLQQRSRTTTPSGSKTQVIQQ